MEKNARVEKKRRVSKSFCKFIVLFKKEKHALRTRASNLLSAVKIHDDF